MKRQYRHWTVSLGIEMDDQPFVLITYNSSGNFSDRERIIGIWLDALSILFPPQLCLGIAWRYDLLRARINWMALSQVAP